MSKVILLLLVVAVLYVLLRARKGRRAADRQRPEHSAARESFAEPFVVCAHCGINLPLSEAVTIEGRHYCCEEHRQLG
ncbi:PP0621 family protein [Sulfurisoma sediminicola]|uniref:PP0621 family protein n=1 Tax=Sulfurisoma sediminicola TaxID=1381557 RepID=UPI000EAE93E0|nr:PP0621 family protein [Sulfurisoma sediminicola]